MSHDLDSEITSQRSFEEQAGKSERFQSRRNGKLEQTNAEIKFQEQEEKVEAIIESLRGSGFTFALWRKRVFDPEFSFVTKVPADDFDIELVKQHHGGGRYMCRVTDKDGKIRNNFHFSIDENFKGRMDAAPEKSVDTIALARTVAEIANQKKDDSGLMMGIMERQQQQSQQFLALMLQMQTENTKAMMGMMSALAGRPQSDGFGTAITPILIKMIESSSNRGDGMMDIERMVKIRDLLTPPETEKPTLVDKVLDAAPAFLPLLLGGGKMQMPMPVVTNLPAAASPPQPSFPSAVANEQASPTPASAAGSPPKIELVPLLKRGAELDSDPASYAVIVLDIVGEGNEHQIVGFLKNDDWKKLFNGFSPEEMKWVENWKKELIDMVEGEDEDAENETPEKL
jgi:hypothetical protein